MLPPKAGTLRFGSDESRRRAVGVKPDQPGDDVETLKTMKGAHGRTTAAGPTFSQLKAAVFGERNSRGALR